MADVAEFYAKDRAAWRQWLAENHDSQTAVWLVYDKGPNRQLTWPDIVQEALCFGWVDSTAGRVSETQSKIYVSKRRPKSGWSKINKQHVSELHQKGLIAPAGHAAINLAKQNGSWDALNKIEALEIPPDLQAALDANSAAKQNFQNFSNSAKKIILMWVYGAKRDETRANRVTETVELAAKNIKANQ